MYNVIFYETADGESEVYDFVDKLQLKAVSDKDARIQHQQITLCIQLLENQGPLISDKIAKHLEEDIWELRPGNNPKSWIIYTKKAAFLL